MLNPTDAHTLTVAAHALITDHSDVIVRGYLKDHPDLIEERLKLVEGMAARVRQQVDRERADGAWGELPDNAEERVELTAEVAEFKVHECDCSWCLNGL